MLSAMILLRRLAIDIKTGLTWILNQLIPQLLGEDEPSQLTYQESLWFGAVGENSSTSSINFIEEEICWTEKRRKTS